MTYTPIDIDIHMADTWIKYASYFKQQQRLGSYNIRNKAITAQLEFLHASYELKLTKLNQLLLYAN